MDVSSETYIRLTEEDLGKLDVIQSSIEEATTHRQLVRGVLITSTSMLFATSIVMVKSLMRV